MKEQSSATRHEETRPMEMSQRLVKAFHGVRYQVSDVSRAVAFYSRVAFALTTNLLSQPLAEFAVTNQSGRQDGY